MLLTNLGVNLCKSFIGFVLLDIKLHVVIDIDVAIMKISGKKTGLYMIKCSFDKFVLFIGL